MHESSKDAFGGAFGAKSIDGVKPFSLGTHVYKSNGRVSNLVCLEHLMKVVRAPLEEDHYGSGFEKHATRRVLCQEDIHVETETCQILCQVRSEFGAKEKTADLLKKTIGHVSLLEFGGERGIRAVIVVIERFPPEEGGVVEKVDCMHGLSALRDVLHGEVALDSFEPGKALEAIAGAIISGGFGGGVEFNNGGGLISTHD